MPLITRWVPPALYLEHKGVKVFHYYFFRDEECLPSPALYYFTLGNTKETEHEYKFHVSRLSAWAKHCAQYDERDETAMAKLVKSVILQAIESGELSMEKLVNKKP